MPCDLSRFLRVPYYSFHISRLLEMQPGISRISLLILPAFSSVVLFVYLTSKKRQIRIMRRHAPFMIHIPKFSIMFACYDFATIEEIVPEKSSAISSQMFHDPYLLRPRPTVLTEFNHWHGTADVACEAHEVGWR